MKGKFFAPTNLMQLKETLEAHKPYAALVVSTTGLDNASFSEHAPTRICLSQFEYDGEINQYKETVTFDKLVQAPQAAIDEAIKNATSYDVFVNGGIDKEAYLKGENVLSAESFKEEFKTLMTALKQDNTTLILNGGLRHCEHYMEKIDCADDIREIAEAGKALDQTRLTQEYFQESDISGNATLENLRNSMLHSPTNSFANDKEKMTDFIKLSKDEFLKTYPYVSEKSYNLTAKDKANRENKIIGGDNRIKVISNFITKYGRDEKVLEPEWEAYQRESAAAYVTGLSEKGKKNYKENNFSGKFSTLIASGKLNPDDIMQGESEFQKLMDTASGKNGKKGIVVIHAATTGFEAGSIPRSTGFPIQFVAVAYESKDGKLDISRNKGCSIKIEAPARSLIRAEENLKKPNGYNTFAEAGMSFEEYKAGKNVEPRDAAIKRINDFFKKYPPEDYAIIAIGGTKGTDKSFTQTCMQNLANFPMCEAPYIDFAQVIKEYSFLACHDDTYPKNVLFDENKMNGKAFGLKDVAEANGINDIRGTAKKCIFVANLINKLEQQQIELFHPEKLVEKVNKEIDENIQTVEATKTKTEQTKAVSEMNEDEAFIEGNGYDNISTEPTKAELERAEYEAQNQAFIESIGAVTEGIGGGVANREHGNLYSDKKNDTVSIVTAKEVQKVGEASIPHISEAPQNRFHHRESAKDVPQNTDEVRRIRVSEEKANARKNSERPTRNVMQGVEKLDINRLIDVIVTQSEMISTQGAIIAEQNAKLFEVLKEQNELMKTVLDNSKQFEMQKSVEVMPLASDKQLDAKNNGDYINYLETIKEQIGSIREQFPTEVGNHLAEANKSLSKGQKEIERTVELKKGRNLE